MNLESNYGFQELADLGLQNKADPFSSDLTSYILTLSGSRRSGSRNRWRGLRRSIPPSGKTFPGKRKAKGEKAKEIGVIILSTYA